MGGCGENMILPIDVVPDTNPPRFRWKQVHDTINGRKVVDYDGVLPASVENAVAALIAMAKQQAREIENLRKINQGLVDRVAAQSELLSKRSEGQQQQSTPKKGKG